MKSIQKIVCLILSVTLVFGAVSVLNSHAESTAFSMELTTDKAAYSYRDTVNLHVQVYNEDGRAYRDVSVIVCTSDYGFPAKRSNETALGTVSANGTAEANYSLILNRRFSGLGFFQRLLLTIRYWFRTFVPVPGAELRGRSYQSRTLTIRQGGRSASVEVYVAWGDAAGTSATEPGTTPDDPPADPTQKALFSLTMLDVGQGLSLLMQSGGKTMLYDGGGRSASSYVVAYLQSHGVQSLDYLVASHYDEDHIAGLVGVLNTTPVATAYTPDYTADTAIYRSLRDKLAQNGCAETHPGLGDTFSFGEATVQFISPEHYNYHEENSFSLSMRVTCGSFSCIMTGDAEKEAEADMVKNGYAVDSDLLVVGHHGSSSSSSESFIRAVAPEYAFISVGAGNPYKHPTAQTLSTLSSNHVGIFRTDELGEVTCYTDGVKFWFSCEPSTDWSEGSYTLSFDANGGSAAPAMLHGAKVYTIPAKQPVRSGYSFLGWGVTANTSFVSYRAGDTLTVTDNTTLYAVWKVNPTFTLFYNANGGYGAPSAQSGSAQYTVSSARPSRSGYTFLGWATNAGASSAVYQPGSIITLSADTTLYAVWQTEPVVHKIYRTRTGKKYHYNPNCNNGNYYECTLEEALAAGLTPCEKCVHD